MTPTMPDLRGAACAKADPDLFFRPEAERGSRGRQRDAAAKAVCATCPVLDACLETALAEPVMGVWGGTTEEERRHFAELDGRRYLTVPSGKGVQRALCGSEAGYQRHLRAKQQACRPCTEANARDRAERKAS